MCARDKSNKALISSCYRQKWNKASYELTIRVRKLFAYCKNQNRNCSRNGMKPCKITDHISIENDLQTCKVRHCTIDQGVNATIDQDVNATLAQRCISVLDQKNISQIYEFSYQSLAFNTGKYLTQQKNSSSFSSAYFFACC